MDRCEMIYSENGTYPVDFEALQVNFSIPPFGQIEWRIGFLSGAQMASLKTNFAIWLRQ